jgi:hypothetical protein
MAVTPIAKVAPESAAGEADLPRVCEEGGVLYEVEVLDVRERPDEAAMDSQGHRALGLSVEVHRPASTTPEA